MDRTSPTSLRSEGQLYRPAIADVVNVKPEQKQQSVVADMPIAAPFLKNVQHLRAFSVCTSIGKIAGIRRVGTDVPVLFIHGNSGSKEVFKFQFESALPRHDLLAIDLPGHGESAHASPQQSTVYSFAGYAQVVAEVIDLLLISQVVLCGWSLGGHVCMELMGQRPDLIKGVVITGAPPIVLSPVGAQQGFRDSEEFKPLLPLMGKADPFTQEEAERFTKAAGVGLATQEECDYFSSMAMRTDGNARACMIASMLDGKGGVDERELVAQCPLPLMIVCGAKDKGINNEYITQLSYKNLYKNQIHMLDDAGHGVFLETPNAVNLLLEGFVKDVT